MPHTYLTPVQERFLERLEYSTEKALQYYLRLRKVHKRQIREIDSAGIYEGDNRNGRLVKILQSYRQFKGPFRFAIRFAHHSQRGSPLDRVNPKLLEAVLSTLTDEERARYLN